MDPSSAPAGVRLPVDILAGSRYYGGQMKVLKFGVSLNQTARFQTAAEIIANAPDIKAIVVSPLPDTESALRAAARQAEAGEADYSQSIAGIGEAYLSLLKSLIPAPLQSRAITPIQIMLNGSLARMREATEELRSGPVASEINVEVTEYGFRDFTLVDVMAAGCSKAVALRTWAADLGITPEEIMAVGDNLNDLGMLEMAGTPVVMGNAVEPLKERGWHMTGTHDEAGLADAIRKLALR